MLLDGKRLSFARKKLSSAFVGKHLILGRFIAFELSSILPKSRTNAIQITLLLSSKILSLQFHVYKKKVSFDITMIILFIILVDIPKNFI